MKKVKVGDRFGLLTVEGIASQDGRGTRWFCKCDCGGHIVLTNHKLLRGFNKSCGCLKTDGKSLCNRCKRELRECEWLLCRPTREMIPWWGEQGVEISVRKDTYNPELDLFTVHKCPWYIS